MDFNAAGSENLGNGHGNPLAMTRTSQQKPPELFFNHSENHSNFAMSNVPALTFSPSSCVSGLSTNIEVPPPSIAGSMAMSASSEINIDTLPLRALLSNAEVFHLFEQRAHLIGKQETLVATHSKLNSDIHGLLNENRGLVNQNQSLNAELAEMRKKVEEMENNRLHPSQLLLASPATLTKVSSEESVSPSDSISQRGRDNAAASMVSTGNQSVIEPPAECPADFSPAVLWTARECHNDPTACKGSRINLTTAIRDKDGNPVRNIEDIKATARIRFLSTLMYLPIPLNAPKHQTGLWWKTYRPTEWRAALRHLEVSHPVTAYCARHWKAEEIFRVVIQTRLDSERAKKETKRPEKTREQPSSGSTDIGTATTSHKRSHSAADTSPPEPSPSLEKSVAVSKPTKKRKKGLY